MENLLDNDLVLSDPPIWDKGRLGRGDDFVKERPKFGDKELWDDFVYDITEAYGSVVIDCGGAGGFWDEHNEGAINLFRHRA